MKYIVLIGLSFLFFNSQVDAQTFEGKIEMKQEIQGESYQAIWYLKKDQIALEMILNTKDGTYKPKFVPQPNKV